MASCSKFYITAEVLAALLESYDEDLSSKILDLWALSVDNINCYICVLKNMCISHDL